METRTCVFARSSVTFCGGEFLTAGVLHTDGAVYCRTGLLLNVLYIHVEMTGLASLWLHCRSYACEIIYYLRFLPTVTMSAM